MFFKTYAGTSNFETLWPSPTVKMVKRRRIGSSNTSKSGAGPQWQFPTQLQGGLQATLKNKNSVNCGMTKIGGNICRVVNYRYVKTKKHSCTNYIVFPQTMHKRRAVVHSWSYLARGPSKLGVKLFCQFSNQLLCEERIFDLTMKRSTLAIIFVVSILF